MQKDGYWVGASVYGYPLDGYGYPMDGYPPAAGNVYHNARTGYEVRNFLVFANILGQNGQQQTCEAVLASACDIYQRYAADLHGMGVSMADGPGWWRRQLDTALPVTDRRIALRSDQLIDTDAGDPRTQGPGSVHDIVMNQKTDKIAYLVIARAGNFWLRHKRRPDPLGCFQGDTERKPARPRRDRREDGRRPESER
jgi:hypothetical protein